MKILIYSLTALSLFLGTQIHAQDSLRITVSSSMTGGTYKIEINGKPFRAIPEETMKKLLHMQAELDALNQQKTAKDSLLSAYAKAEFWYGNLLRQYKVYTTEMEGILNGYKDLVNDYKKLSEPWLYLSAGIGASGPETKPSAMIGLGIRSVRLWGIFQERNTGVMFGTEMPLF